MSRVLLRNEREKLRSRQQRQREKTERDREGERERRGRGEERTEKHARNPPSWSPPPRHEKPYVVTQQGRTEEKEDEERGVVERGNVTQSTEAYTVSLLKKGLHSDSEILDMVAMRMREKVDGGRSGGGSGDDVKRERGRGEETNFERGEKREESGREAVKLFAISQRVPQVLHTNQTQNFHREGIDLCAYDDELVIEYDERGIPRSPPPRRIKTKTKAGETERHAHSLIPR